MNGFLERREVGRTGMRTARLGIGSTFDAPASAIEEAFEHGINAVHRGAERDVFPFVPEVGPRPLIVAYTATRWKHLLDPDKMPPGEKPLTARDCYRYSLSHPAVDMVLCGPASTDQMREALLALERGPLEADERERIERIGAYLASAHTFTRVTRRAIRTRATPKTYRKGSRRSDSCRAFA